VGKLLGGLIGIIGALWLGIAGAWGIWMWDRQPERPAWTQASFLFLRWPHFLRDPSLAMQARQNLAAFATEQNSFRLVDSALSLQNDRVRALGAHGALVLAKQQTAVSAYAAASAALPTRIATANQITVGDDLCARDASIDENFLKALAQ
jgi:hypothetical protein